MTFEVMLTVSVYYLNQNAETVKAGEVRWDGKAITISDPSSRRLDNLLTMPLHLPGGRELYPDDDPELFVRSLYLMYHGSYFHCEQAVEK